MKFVGYFIHWHDSAPEFVTLDAELHERLLVGISCDMKITKAFSVDEEEQQEEATIHLSSPPKQGILQALNSWAGNLVNTRH